MNLSGPMHGRVLVFARAPVPGASKTRLVPALGAEGAAQLSARMLRHTLNTACSLPLELWCTPSVRHPVFDRCARDFRLTLRTQRGADLGERMHNALEETLTHAHWAVLIGTDCPELTSRDLRQAAAALAGGVDGVLGPAADGGYYLIGLRQPMAALFHGVHWGTGEVLAQTRDRLRDARCCWHELPVYSDLDRPEDLWESDWFGNAVEDGSVR